MLKTQYLPPPWPADGAVITQRPGDDDAACRKANYDRARACVSALAGFSNPSDAVLTLLDAANTALASLPSGAQRARLAAVVAEAAAAPEAS